jgi:DNA-directed RNA polymerase specialized sigma24 family protein
MLRSRRSVPRLASPAEVPWLQPYPDWLLDQVPSPEKTPDEAAISRETISLAFLAALQVLPPRQRAALIARDVLGSTASEAAAVLGTSVAEITTFDAKLFPAFGLEPVLGPVP